MTEEILRWIRKENLIERGDFVIAGVSGGADSICMLLVLEELKEKLGIRLQAVHVEHGIRGEESRKDAEFVRNLCESRGTDCRIFSVDVPAFAKAEGVGLEEAARILRYRCYEQAARNAFDTAENVKISLAHHADDNAETMLFQLIRGSSIDGLGAIPPKRELAEHIILIRPLLFLTRKEIENRLCEAGQEYRNDITNADTEYSRNRIRHEILPQLCKINAGAVRHINRSAAELREIADFLDFTVKEILPKVSRREGNAVYLKEKLLDYPLVLQRKIVYQAIREAAGSGKDLGAVHVEEVLNLFYRQTGRRVSLPYHLLAKHSYGEVRIGKDLPETNDCSREVYTITAEQLQCMAAGETMEIDVKDVQFSLKIINFQGNMEKITKKKYTKWLNYDKIKGGLQIRRPQKDDFLVIDDSGHRKKLKDYLAGEKVPAEKRNRIWILAEGAHVLWVTGGRISAYYKTAETTDRVLLAEVTVQTGRTLRDESEKN